MAFFIITLLELIHIVYLEASFLHTQKKQSKMWHDLVDSE